MTVKSNLKAFGFESYDAGIEKAMESYMKNFARNMVDKASKKCGAEGKIEAKHVSCPAAQAGGRVVLPSQYFGVDNSSYAENPAMGTNMNVTATTIRPAMDPYAVIMEGAGARKFKAAKSKVADVVKKAAGEKKVSGCAIIAIRAKFEETMTKALKKAKGTKKAHAEHNSHLSAKAFEEIIKGSKAFKDLMKA